MVLAQLDWSHTCGSKKGEQALVIALQVAVYNRVVVALVALHVPAQKDSSDIAGHQVWLGIAIHQESSPDLIGLLGGGCQ